MRKAAWCGLMATMLLGVAILARGQAPAGKAEEPAPTADQILEKYVKALGGKEAILKVTSRVARGDFEVPEQGTTGTAEVSAKAPNKSSLTLAIDGFGQIRQGTNGAIAWQDNPQAGYREFSGPELEERKRGAEFHFSVRLRDLYPKLTVIGKQKSGERDAWVVEGDPGNGRIRRFFFDAETGLLIRSEGERKLPTGESVLVQTFFEEYKEYDGIKVAVTIRQVNPQFSTVIRFKEVLHNVPVDEAKFDKP